MIRAEGPWFKDEHGRTLLLRGVNLGGSTKVPAQPDEATGKIESFFDHRQVTFVGRPFALEEAADHFARLREWGLTFERFLVSWEAIEHAGPGLYDREYLDYVHAVIQKAADFGISVFIDPHQDVWSRFSGGDGAPGWTFEVAGLDLTRFHQAGAAILHQVQGDPFPRMVWPSNATKLASATMFTLFFGGNDFAPLARVDGEPVQEYLQRHYIAAIQELARRLSDLPNMVGYDSLNEPSAGWIGVKDLSRFPSAVKIGASPTPFQSMLLGAGYPQEIEVWDMRTSGAKLIERKTFNEARQSVWLNGKDCIWKTQGVWEVSPTGEPRLLKPDYFAMRDGRPVDFERDYLRPFVNRFAAAIRETAPATMIFMETEPGHLPPAWSASDASGIVSAPHWYDGLVLFLKDFHTWMGIEMPRNKIILGRRNIRRSYARQLERLKEAARDRLGDVPTLIGETGIPFDMKGRKAYRTGNFHAQVQAMDRTLKAMDDALLSYSLWNYTADNSNERGDQWNGEDLSIFSRDQQKDPADIHSGGRALEAVVRPYARATAGEPLRMSFDIRKKRFEYEFRHGPEIGAPTEFFIPNYQYPRGYAVKVSDGTYECDPASQKLTYRHTDERETHRVVVTKI